MSIENIVEHCGNKCADNMSCSEDKCVPYRIEQKTEKAIKYCENLIERYDRNIDITDIDICYIIEILQERE